MCLVFSGAGWPRLSWKRDRWAGTCYHRHYPHHHYSASTGRSFHVHTLFSDENWAVSGSRAEHFATVHVSGREIEIGHFFSTYQPNPAHQLTTHPLIPTHGPTRPTRPLTAKQTKASIFRLQFFLSMSCFFGTKCTVLRAILTAQPHCTQYHGTVHSNPLTVSRGCVRLSARGDFHFTRAENQNTQSFDSTNHHSVIEPNLTHDGRHKIQSNPTEPIYVRTLVA